MAKKVTIIGTNQMFESLRDKEFDLEAMYTTPEGVHVIKLVDYENAFYFDPNSRIQLNSNFLRIEGITQVQNSVSLIALVIQI